MLSIISPPAQHNNKKCNTQHNIKATATYAGVPLVVRATIKSILLSVVMMSVAIPSVAAPK
jgi:hypothetical protein